MRKEFQHALTHEASVRHDQLQRTLRQQVCQEEHADAEPTRKMTQLQQLIAEQAEAMKRYEARSQQFVSQQQEECAHKQHAQFQRFDSALRAKDIVIQSLRQELPNNNERYLQENSQSKMQSVEPSNQAQSLRMASLPSCTRHRLKKTLHAVAAVAHAAPAPAFHLSRTFSWRFRGEPQKLRTRNKGSSTMVVPVHRRLRAKTPPAAAQRVPSMGLVRRRIRSKGPPPQPPSQPLVRRDSGGALGPAPPGGGDLFAGGGLPDPVIIEMHFLDHQDFLYDQLREVHQLRRPS